MDIESFNYVISSDDRTNTTANQVFYDIDFGGFADSPYDDYYVSVSHVNYQPNGTKLTLSSVYTTLEKDVYLEQIISTNTATIIGHVVSLQDPTMYNFPAGRVNDEGDTQTKRLILEPMYLFLRVVLIIAFEQQIVKYFNCFFVRREKWID